VRIHRLLSYVENAGAAAAKARSTVPFEAARNWRRKVLSIGFFPPPVDGQRLITQRMFERLDAATIVARHDLDQFPRLGRLSKPLSAIAACLLLIAARLKGFSTLYLAPHSGMGLAYSCAIVATARALGYRLSIHYHSYRNMARHSQLMAMFIALCGRDATHIVLAPPMAQDLRGLYGKLRDVAVLSNAVFVRPRDLRRRPAGGRLRLGHLSNLSRQKGIVQVLDCLRELVVRGVDVELRLAGPAGDAETRALISAAEAELRERLVYLGRLDAEGVHGFYDGIDAFLFPTMHEHEAEPLVIVDAVAAGVPVIATDRGCIGYLLAGEAGTVFAAPDFVAKAVDCIAHWAGDPHALADASARAAARFRELHGASRAQLDRLIDGMVDERLPPRRARPRDTASRA
jgi:glycosyltransferase involved in cell wall biosynthesis